MVQTMKYEGTTPVEGFLKTCELARTQLLASNPQSVHKLFWVGPAAARHDPIIPPAKNQHGMSFFSPSTWRDEQEPTDVDSYNNIKANLETQFALTIRTSTQNFTKIQTIKCSLDKTVEEFIHKIDKMVERSRLEMNA